MCVWGGVLGGVRACEGACVGFAFISFLLFVVVVFVIDLLIFLSQDLLVSQMCPIVLKPVGVPPSLTSGSGGVLQNKEIQDLMRMNKRD